MAKLTNSESKSIEYKRKFTKNILKTISAFANYNDGEIFIGVDDDLSIVGVDDLEYLRYKLEQAIDENISPKPYYEIIEKDMEGKTILILKVKMGKDTPYLYENKAYKRLGASTLAVDIFDYENLILNGKGKGYDELIIMKDKLEFNYLEEKLRDTISIGMMSDDILRTLGIMKKDKYTNAALLLSDNNPISYSGISLVRFEGNSVDNIKDKLLLNNISILEMYYKCIDFYNKHIINNEIEQVPFVAYGEAVANAIVHRDYTIEAECKVEIYDDRVEVISPGGLPIGITSEEYINGRNSVPRNMILVDVLHRLGIIKRLAAGIRRIKEYYRNYNNKPEFIINNDSIKVVLPYNGYRTEMVGFRE